MNFQPAVQPKPSVNGVGNRRVERDAGARSENKFHSLKSNSARVTNTAIGGKAGVLESPTLDRMVYLTTCLIGHPVEVQVKNGSVYSGIFHATDAEKDFGIILKVARMIKEGTFRGQKSRSEFVSKPPSKTLIIPAKELVQIIAKDVAVTRGGLSNDFQCEKQQELLTDSNISQSCHVDVERELTPWVPDEDVPLNLELENVFDNPWNRGWDQFETNEMLFGVKSTFNEELYTTKLERGPRMRELEQEALRIAREIEGEETKDLHIAEERGFQLPEKFDIDEETRYSSVHREVKLDDSGYEDEEDILLDARNTQTFGDTSTSSSKRPASGGRKSNDKARDDIQSSLSTTNVDLKCSVSDDHAWQLASEHPSKNSPALDSESRIEDNQLIERREHSSQEFVDKQTLPEDFSVPKPEDSQSLDGKEDTNGGGQSANTISDPSLAPSKSGEKQSSLGGQTVSQVPGKAIGSTKPESVGAASASSGPGLSPSSSVGSLSSEKSTLNPNAKEFKLNPNAKSFKPSQPAVRPPSPISDGSFYYSTGVSAVPQMHGMPVGYSVGPSFAGHQPVIYTPQLTPVQTPQPYFPPNGPQYGQQMMLGQPRPVVYMPTYQPEMSFKGRDY